MLKRGLSEMAEIYLSDEEYDRAKSYLSICFHTKNHKQDERWTAEPHYRVSTFGSIYQFDQPCSPNTSAHSRIPMKIFRFVL